MQVDALFLFEFLAQVIDDTQVEVLTAQEGVTAGRQNLELVFALDVGDLDNRDIERAAAQVENRDLGVAALLVHAVGQRCRGRLVDDALDLEAGDTPGVLGRLALGIVEIGRHRDHRLGDLFAEIILGGLLHFHQHARGDFRRRHLLVFHFHPGVTVVRLDDLVGHHVDVLLHDIVLEAASDEALDGVQGVVGVGNRLALGRLPHQDLVVLRVGDDGGRGAAAFRVLDDLRTAAFTYGDAGIGGSKVYADDLAHNDSPVFLTD